MTIPKVLNNQSVLIVGGAMRNVGKTTLVTRIIQKFSTQYQIIALKIKTIYPNDDFFHGKERRPLLRNFEIEEETSKSGNADTMRMLNVGAHKVFKIRTSHEFLQQAFEQFMTNFCDRNSLLICESVSLREFYQPNVFLMIISTNSEHIKPSAKRLLYHADALITTDGSEHDFDLNRLAVKNNVWVLN